MQKIECSNVNSSKKNNLNAEGDGKEELNDVKKCRIKQRKKHKKRENIKK